MQEFVAIVTGPETKAPTAPVVDPAILLDFRAGTDDEIRYTGTTAGIPEAVLLPTGERIKVVAKKRKFDPTLIINGGTPLDKEGREARASYLQWRLSTLQLISKELYFEKTTSADVINNQYVDNYLLSGSFLAYVWDRLGGKGMSQFYAELTKSARSMKDEFKTNLKMLPNDIRFGIDFLKRLARQGIAVVEPNVAEGLSRAMRDSESDSTWASCLDETEKLLKNWEKNQRRDISYLTLSVPEWNIEIKGMMIGKFQEGADEWFALRQVVAAIQTQFKELGIPPQRKNVTVMVIADNQEIPHESAGGNEQTISALSRKARHDGFCSLQQLIVVYPYQYSRTWDDQGITIDTSKIFEVIQHEIAHQGDANLTRRSTTTAQYEGYATATQHQGNFNKLREVLLHQEPEKAAITPDYLGTLLCGEGGIDRLKKTLTSVFGKTPGFSAEQFIVDYMVALRGDGSQPAP